MSQEFSLPDVLTVWDALLTDDTRTQLLTNVATAMISLVRDSLLHNDFASNMKMLQVWFYQSNIKSYTTVPGKNIGAIINHHTLNQY